MADSDAYETYGAAWGLLSALAREDWDTATLISENWAPGPMCDALVLVGEVLLSNLRHHAEDRGCDCGSQRWVEDQALHAANLEGKEDT